MSGASGAGRTGLASLIELTAAGSAGDAFVAVSLAGTLFFSASLDQARGRVALALVVTMAPFAVLAPLIGPMLDKMQQGRRYLLAGTLLARGLLCWAMAGAVEHNDTLQLLPAAFGVLVLQKAYGVTRSAVAPRLVPAELTLVTANARTGMASLIASTVAAPLAAGIDVAAGGGTSGAAWVLRAATAVYLAATALSFRIPEHVDIPEPRGEGVPPARRAGRAAPGGPAGTRPMPGTPPTDAYPAGAPPGYTGRPAAPGYEGGSTAPGYAGGPTAPGTAGRPGTAARPGGATARPGAPPPAGRPAGPGAAGRPGGPGAAGRPGGARVPGQPPGAASNGAAGQRPAAPASGASRWRTLRRVGPIVGEAMRANATLRAFSGFMIFFLAFLLRIEHFPHVNDKVALGAMIAAAAAGGFLGTALGSGLRARKPYVITFGMLAVATVTTAACAVFFGLWAALVVSLVAAFGQVLGKLALDSTVQQEIGEEIRSSTFAVSETLHQLSWVAGGLAGLAMSFTSSGIAGLTVAAVGLGLSLVLLLGQRRRRILTARQARARAVT
jgi:Major Facilitator Superfamily